MVCFFSLFTHLRHEESYLYLQEARRVLAPGGKIIFSFLEFPNPHHWNVFEHNLTQVAGMEPLNQFISTDAIKIWALHLGLRVTSLNRSGKITLSQAYQLHDGRVLQGTALFGQSVCVVMRQGKIQLTQVLSMRGPFWFDLNASHPLYWLAGEGTMTVAAQENRRSALGRFYERASDTKY